MNKVELEKLGSVVYAQSVKPLKPRRSRGIVIGFDTEYNSETNELYSLQFSCQGHSKFVDMRNREISWEVLEHEVKKFLSESEIKFWKKTLILVCYWSIAELQHLPMFPSSVEIIENAKTYNVNYRMSSKNYLMVFDLFPFFLSSLSQVAESFGLQKLDWDTSQVNHDLVDNLCFRAYAINDAILCEKICIRFRELIWEIFSVDILLTKTPANTAMTAYRVNYVEEDLGQDWVEVRRMSLLCSWGGNNQAFRRGKFNGKLEEWDAISMYPSSAIQIGELPVTGDWKRSRTLEENIEAKGSLALVRFEFPLNCEYPSLPVFERGKLCYPTSGTSYCTGYEIRFALEQKCKITFIKGFHYLEGNGSLAKFIKRLMKLKSDASVGLDIPKRNMAKLLMNAIIGKFTQKRRVVPLEEWKRVSKDLGLPLDEAMRMYGLPVKERILLGSGFMPEWNTLILGYSRSVMSRGYAKYGAYLGTTDSMIIESPGVEEIEIEGIKFKREYRADEIFICRTRLYCCYHEGDLIKVAEHGLIMSKQEAAEAIKSSVKGVKEVCYHIRRPTKLREAWRRGLRFGSFLQRPRTSSLEWDGKRKLKEDGTTRPLISVGEMV